MFLCLLPSSSKDISVVQSLSHVWLFATPWTAAHQPSLSFTICWNLLTFMSIESVMPFNHLLFAPFSSLQSFPASGSFPMSWLFTLRWPKYQSFSFSISPSNEYSGLISLRIFNKDQSFCIKGPLYSSRTLTNYNCKNYFQIRYHFEVLGRMWIWRIHYSTLYHGVAPGWDTEEGWYQESRQTHRAGQGKRAEVSYSGKPRTVLKLGGHSGRKETDNWCFLLTQAQAEIWIGIL